MGVLHVDLFAEGRSMRDKLMTVGLARLSKDEHVLAIPAPRALTMHQPLTVTVIAAQTPWNFHVHEVRHVSYISHKV